MNREEEKKLIIYTIGVLDALYNDRITLCESERALFLPRIHRELSQKGCDGRILCILAEGCELEDILSLLPNRYKENIQILKEKSLSLLDDYNDIVINAY
jgi:hypothetical protein